VAFRSAHTEKKAVAVRSLQADITPITFTVVFNFETGQRYVVPVFVPAEAGADAAFYRLQGLFNRAAKADGLHMLVTYGNDPDPQRGPEPRWKLSIRDGSSAERGYNLSGSSAEWWQFVGENDDWVTDFPAAWWFPKCWDRKSAVLHSSLSRDGVVGSSGEFYTNPSKIFPVTEGEHGFFLWMTTDGKTPLGYENFSVGLTFILDYDDYIG
jgi:hypothetical protein